MKTEVIERTREQHDILKADRDGLRDYIKRLEACVSAYRERYGELPEKAA